MSTMNINALDQGNFWRCDSRYGDHLPLAACINALGQLPGEITPQTYIINGQDSHSLPSSFTTGDCTIAVELGGPADPTGLGTYLLNPSEVRTLAGFLIGRCVAMGEGLGGFATGAFENMLSFVNNPQTGHMTLFPVTSTFLTITVAAPNTPREPGNYDPSIPWRIFESQANTGPATRNPYYMASQAMQSLQNRVGGQNCAPWWQYLSLSLTNKMDYTCNADLGAPSKVDCALLEYERLGAPSDVISIEPGASKVLTSNTCSVAISSSIPITLTWEQITAAVDALVNMCVSSPIKGSAIGGTATYGIQGVSLAGRRRKRQAPNISGLNALPQGVKITLYELGHYTP